MKQFEEFEALVPEDFARRMVVYWRVSENASEEDVLKWYYDEQFKALDKRIANTKRRFKPDLGYKDDEINGTLCFEVEDNNFVMPVDMLEVI